MNITKVLTEQVSCIDMAKDLCSPFVSSIYKTHHVCKK